MSLNFTSNPSLRGTDPVDALRLIRSERVGPATFFGLVKLCGSVKKAIEMAPEMSRRGGSKKPITIAVKAEAEREFEALTRYGAQILLYGDAHYPQLLHTVTDAPPVLTLRGHAHVFAHTKLVGMVGARNASANGCAFAKKLAADLGAAGYTVISGLARGIDAAAHRGALATGTVGVIGGGINNVYPPENAELFDLLAAGGAILSELPFGAQPHARSFPGRNRIIAGMSQGVVVVEASLKSGSLITANFATDYGRDVFAVPGSPMDPRCNGTNKLLKDGATLVESVRDVIANLSPMRDLPLFEQASLSFHEAPAPALDETYLAEARAALLTALSASPTLLDELLIATGLTPQVLLAVLLELELAGRIERHAGGRVALRMFADET